MALSLCVLSWAAAMRPKPLQATRNRDGSYRDCDHVHGSCRALGEQGAADAVLVTRTEAAAARGDQHQSS